MALRSGGCLFMCVSVCLKRHKQTQWIAVRRTWLRVYVCCVFSVCFPGCVQLLSWSASVFFFIRHKTALHRWCILSDSWLQRILLALRTVKRHSWNCVFTHQVVRGKFRDLFCHIILHVFYRFIVPQVQLLQTTAKTAPLTLFSFVNM